MAWQHRFIDAAVGHDGIGAAVAGDFDGDGRAEFACGGKGGGFYYVYDLDPAADAWRRHLITTDFAPQVGAVAADFDGDGLDEIVCGEWGPRLLHIRRTGPTLDDWTHTVVWTGLRNPHDVILADVDADGRDEVIIREKDGRLLVFDVPDDPLAAPWPVRQVAADLAGDGTAACIRPDGAADLVTNAGWFRNIDGRGGEWARSGLIPPDLGWHCETRLAVADLDGAGRPSVVITESEIRPARLAILRRADDQAPWTADVLIGRADQLGGLHSLQVADLRGIGRPQIFTAEMENNRTNGTTHKPRWWLLSPDREGWTREAILDTNLGAHSAVIADFDGDGRPEIASKVWRANAVNGNAGANHVDHLRWTDDG
jgi:hypothetical protein